MGEGGKCGIVLILLLNDVFERKERGSDTYLAIAPCRLIVSTLSKALRFIVIDVQADRPKSPDTVRSVRRDVESSLNSRQLKS
jgi:hypothetical protein